MSTIRENKKFKRTKRQDTPLSINRELEKNKEFEIDADTIKKNQKS